MRIDKELENYRCTDCVWLYCIILVEHQAERILSYSRSKLKQNNIKKQQQQPQNCDVYILDIDIYIIQK